jgi:hypothetical protein
MACYLLEAALVLAFGALHRYYNLLHALTLRQSAILLAPIALVVASGVYILIRVRSARTSVRVLSLTIALNMAAVLPALAVGEALVRAFEISTPAGPALGGTLLLPRSWAEVRARHEAILARSPSNVSYLMADDLLGWRPAPGRRSTDGLYASSAEGLRSARAGISYRARAARQRVAILGDSFTFGLEVPFEQSWGALLESALGADVTVLNFGVDGYGVDQSYLRYERDARLWTPDVTLFGFIGHDLVRTLSVYPSVTFPDWGFPFSKPRLVLNDDGVLERVNTHVESPAEILRAAAVSDLPFVGYDVGYNPDEWTRRFYHASHLIRLLVSRVQRWPSRDLRRWEDDLEPINTAILTSFVTQATADGARPLVVYFPARGDLTRRSRRPKDAVLDALRAAGADTIDLTSCIEAIGERRAFIDGRPHYSRDGNAEVARCLLPWVRDRLVRG